MSESPTLGRAAPHSVSHARLLRDGTDDAFRGLVDDLMTFSHQIQQMRERIAAEMGVSPPQYAILMRLAHWVGPPPIVSDLAAALRLSVPFVVTETGHLARVGLIEKRGDPEDGRRVRLHLTDAALRALEAVAPYIRAINDNAFGGLTIDEFDALRSLMATLTEDAVQALAVEPPRSPRADH